MPLSLLSLLRHVVQANRSMIMSLRYVPTHSHWRSIVRGSTPIWPVHPEFPITMFGSGSGISQPETGLRARADLASGLYDFLAPVSLSAARRAALVILDGADRIAENPGIGIARAEFREWPARFGRSAYILRYTILSEDEILMVRVWHSPELREE